MTAMLLRPLELAVNRALGLDPEVPQRLRPLIGKIVRLELTVLPGPLWVEFHADRVRLLDSGEHADAMLKASPTALAAYAARRGEGSADVEFRGDVAVVQALRNLLAKLEIDFEEQLSRFTGDLLAHQIGNGLRSGLGWLNHVQRTFERNLGEYLTEESRQVPGRAELDAFLADVDALRQAADRLDARLKLVERRRT